MQVKIGCYTNEDYYIFEWQNDINKWTALNKERSYENVQEMYDDDTIDTTKVIFVYEDVEQEDFELS